MTMGSAARLRLDEILKELGWTQKRLSEETGISEQAIINLVRNPKAITFETISKLIAATGRSVEDLIVYEDNNSH